MKPTDDKKNHPGAFKILIESNGTNFVYEMNGKREDLAFGFYNALMERPDSVRVFLEAIGSALNILADMKKESHGK